ncbi:MAG: DMT family transporter [Bullifex sp.]
MNRKTATLLLLLTALIWGCSFVAQDVSSDFLGPFTFNFTRFFIGSAVLIPFVIRNRKGRKISAEDDKRCVLAGMCCGTALAAASVVQQIGVQYSGAGKGGFITSLYNIFVPIILLLMGRKVNKKIFLYAIMAVAGMYLLCIGDTFRIEKGDLYLLLCALAFAVHIIVIDRFTDVDGITLSCLQFFTSGIICLSGALLTETIRFDLIMKAAVPVLYAGVFSCGIAYTLQVVAQKYIHPTVATLVLSLESVFSVLAAWVILGDTLSAKELIGCAVVFAAVLLAQLPQKNT